MMVIAAHDDSAPPESSPRPHRTPRETREILMQAAGRIARIWRLQRFGLILTWLALLVVSVYASLGFVQVVPLPLHQGVGLMMLWAALILLTLSHIRRTDGLIDRIIVERLCFACGQSNLDTTTDDSGAGQCTKCNRQFNLSEYSSTTACLEALRAVRIKLHERLHGETLPDERLAELKAEHRNRIFAQYHPRQSFDRFNRPTLLKPPRDEIPPDQQIDQIKAALQRGTPAVYESPKHFERVMSRAARRLVWPKRPLLGLRFVMWGAALPLAVGLLGLLLMPLLAELDLVPLAGVLILLAPCYAIAIAWQTTQEAKVARILDHHLCLACGHPLKAQPLNTVGVGHCPECGKAFHTREYVPPQTDVINPWWQETRTALFQSVAEEWEADADKAVAVDSQYELPHAESSPEKGSCCPNCDYPLSGLAVDDDGEGACPECGTPFWRTNDHIATANTSIMALGRVREKRRKLRESEDDR